MFDGTFLDLNSEGMEGQLPSSFAFPFIEQLSAQKPALELDANSTLEHSAVPEDPNTRIYHEIYEAFVFAKHTFLDLDKTQLNQAFAEAKILAASRLFGDELLPNVSIDPYGEFTFCHRSDAGYVDIGVRGDGELSYHVRNDRNPDMTRFDDHSWSDFHVPNELFSALKALRQHL